MNGVKVLEIRPLSDGRPLKAFVDIQIGDWIIYDWRIVKHEGQRAWVSMLVRGTDTMGLVD